MRNNRLMQKLLAIQFSMIAISLAISGCQKKQPDQSNSNRSMGDYNLEHQAPVGKDPSNTAIVTPQPTPTPEEVKPLDPKAFERSNSRPSLIHSDISDIIEYSSELSQDEDTQKTIQLVKILQDNLGTSKLNFSTDDLIYSVQLIEIPRLKRGTKYEVHWVVMVKSQSDEVFKKHATLLDLDKKEVLKDIIFETIKMNETHFVVQMGLLQRKIVLEDKAHELKIIFPVAVGAFDEGVMQRRGVRIMTPTFEGAKIERSQAIANRTDPDYYRGLPFIRITSPKGNGTAYAFHIFMGETFYRGFFSRGCLRIRQKDLQLLYEIVANGGSESIPLNIRYNVTKDNTMTGEVDLEDNPYPMTNYMYDRVKNFGTNESPFHQRADHSLIILERINSAPPSIEKILPYKPVYEDDDEYTAGDLNLINAPSIFKDPSA